jgi:hypothetical protein
MSTLVLSLREMRLIVERLVQAAGTPTGLLPAVRDCAFFSAALPGPGLEDFVGRVEALRASRPAPLRLLADEPALDVDCGGQHAWFAAEALLDIAVERFRLTGEGCVIARNLGSADELRVASGLVERYGLRADVAPSEHGMRLTVRPRAAGLRTLLDVVREGGVAVDPALWWPLYHASHDALAPDSFESRRHAGTIRVEADGRIIGRNDEDETDLAMLAPDPSRLVPGLLSPRVMKDSPC